MITTPTTIFFDLDDTLVDYSGRHRELWAVACERYAPEVGIDPTHLGGEIEAYRRWYWSDPARHAEKRQDMRGARREIVLETFRRLALENPGTACALADFYSDSAEAAICLFPDTLDALQALQGRGITLALITNGHSVPQRGKIERFDLAPYFDCVVIEGEFGVGKPHPSVYHHALAQVGAEPAAAWMVGDNLDWDVAGAQSVGIAGIWIDRAGVGLPPGSDVVPDRTIRGLAELTDAYLPAAE